MLSGCLSVAPEESVNGVYAKLIGFKVSAVKMDFSSCYKPPWMLLNQMLTMARCNHIEII